MKIAVSIILILTLSSLLPFAFAQSMITIGLGSEEYKLGQPILAQGILTLGQNDPKGLPVSVELYDPNGNAVDAQTLPVTDNQFTYSIPTGVGTKVTQLGKFTIVAYYGNPTPMLLNTPQSTKVYFEITNTPSTPSGTVTLATQQMPSQSSPYNPLTSSSLSGNTPLFITIVIILVGAIAVFGRSRRHPQQTEYTNTDIPIELPRRGWSEQEKEQVRIRQRGLCKLCGKPPPRWEYHHRDGNRSNNSLNNCEGLCPNCHSVKTHE